jgi:lipopolysaccharide/colanic/teichoic acid biosynthesis glycosyltransferase
VYRAWGKQLFDRFVAALTLLALSPLLIALIVAVRVRLGSPALFWQRRVGYRDREFWLCKLRTMTDARDATGQLLSDQERLPPFGRWLRSTSLDELPELWNVLRGEMSLVGPRPLLTQYLPLYTAEQRRRHRVRPGLTGLAQTRGRNSLAWDERFRLDVEYVDNVSWRLDLRILVDTVRCVVQREGISAVNHATMPPFEGSQVEGSQVQETARRAA